MIKIDKNDLVYLERVPEVLYHGTCKAFVAYALQNEGKFGSEFNSVSFTPDVEHARTFAESWRTERGVRRLREMFGENIESMLSELSEPILLEFPAHDLGSLRYKVDCGKDEYYVERGPVNINKGTIVQ